MWLSQDYLTPSKSEPPLEAGEAPCEFVGEEVQRLSVVQNLPQLLEGNEQLCMQRVVPRVQLALPNASTEFHMAASSTFKTILEKKLVHPRTFTQTFLQSILSSIDSRDPVVANAWLETLLDVIDLLPSDVVKSDILPIAVNKGQISQKLNTRITACKLLGKISTRVDQQTLKKDTLPIILSLCQDVKADVRACICSQLPFVAQGLGAEGVKPNILPLLVELASDEEAMVRLSAVEAIVCMLPHLQQDTKKNIIVPLVKKMCEASIRNEDNVMVVLAQVFGELCLGLETSLTQPEKKWFINCYQQLAELGLRATDREFGATRKNMPDIVPLTNKADKFVECRHHCAFHFPAMTVFCTSSSDNFDEQLYPVFCGLACDPYFEVRRTIACGLHEVTRVLGHSNGMVKSELVKLLRDDSEEVLTGLIPNLARTLTLLTRSGAIKGDFMDTSSMEVGRALLKCESEVSATNNWRLHETLIQQLQCLHTVLTSEFIHSYFTPVLFTRIHRARQLPVRMAATNTLLVYMRYNTKSLQRTDIRSRIMSELCNGHSCYSRLSFMRLCSQAMELFSKKYFKEHFYLSMLERAEDPVPNIRLIFVKLLPRLKTCLRMPSDKKYFAALESSIRKLISLEKDKDVLSALDKSLTQLDKIECTLDTARVTGQSSRDEQEDNKKMEEEARLALVVPKQADGKSPFLSVPAASPPPPTLKPGQTRYGPPSSSNVGMSSNVSVTAAAMSQRRGVPPATGTTSQLQRSDPSDSSTRPRAASVGTRSDLSSRPSGLQQARPSTQMSARERDLELQSLEDEFFRDAGVKIPRHFAASGLPLRVANGREKTAKEEELKGETEGSKGAGSKLTPPRKGGSVARREGNARRHSYLEGEKPGGEGKKVTTTLDNSRRHSYIERLQISTSHDGDANQAKRLSYHAKEENQSYRSPITRGAGDASIGTNQAKRLSFHAKEENQNYRSPISRDSSPVNNQSKRLSLHAKEDHKESSLQSKRLSFHAKDEPSYRKPLSRDTSPVNNQSKRLSYHAKEENNSYQSPISRDTSLGTNQSKRLSFQGKEELNYRKPLSRDSSPVNNQSKRLSFHAKEENQSPISRDTSLSTNQSKRLSFQAKDELNYRKPLSRDSSPVNNQSKRLSFHAKEENQSRDSSPVNNQAKRLSFHAKEEQSYRSPISQTKPAIPLRKNAVRSPQTSEPKTDATNRCRSINFSARTEPTDGSVKRRSLIAPVPVSKPAANRRHSSLEREELNRVYETKLRRPGFVTGAGARSNQSSPGGSRSGSPSGGRGRHLTAPNSRAGSPTGTLLGYLGNIKLTEPCSRLPVRKK